MAEEEWAVVLVGHVMRDERPYRLKVSNRTFFGGESDRLLILRSPQTISLEEQEEMECRALSRRLINLSRSPSGGLYTQRIETF